MKIVLNNATSGKMSKMTKYERIDVSNWKAGEIVNTIENEEEFLSIIVDVQVRYRLAELSESKRPEDLAKNLAVYAVNILHVIKHEDGLYSLDESMEPKKVAIQNVFKISDIRWFDEQ